MIKNEESFKKKRLGIIMKSRNVLFLLATCLFLQSSRSALALFNSSQQCTTSVQQQQDSLIAFYKATGGPSWSNQSDWLNVSIPCYAKNDSGVSVPLPSQCCWFGVNCCYQTACSTATSLVGATSCDCEVGTVTGLQLNRNNLVSSISSMLASLSPLQCSLKYILGRWNSLSGTIPSSLYLFQNMTILSIGNNSITGTIPRQIGLMPYLYFLDLSSNSLSGTVPSDLCTAIANVTSDANGSSLQDLLLPHNNLHGSFDVPSCNSLVRLDIGSNNFSGLGTFQNYAQLRILRIGGNVMKSELPSGLANSLLMADFSSNSNLLSGNISMLTAYTYLASLDLNNNSFTGTLPSVLFENMGLLRDISISNNTLYGTLPSSLALSPLTYIGFGNNSFYGTIPNSVSDTSVDKSSIDFTGNSLFCCGTKWNGSTNIMSYEAINTSLPLLPSFIRFSSILQAVYPDTNTPAQNGWGPMSCPGFVNPVTYPTGPDTVEMLLPVYIDPQYYLFTGCVCTSGFVLTLVPNPDVLVVPTYACVPVACDWICHNSWIIAVIVIGSLLVMAWLTWLMCYRRRSRPVFVQAVANMRKRVKGEPTSGSITMVNTDIEGYSDLMKGAPELMTQALNLHNAVIRNARWTTFGYVIEQEGDSFTLCFYEAIDAITFALMSQQALMQQQWPEGLMMKKNMLDSSKKSAGAGIMDFVSKHTSWLSRPSKKSLYGSGESGVSMHVFEPSTPRSRDEARHRRTSMSDASAGLSCFNGLRVRMGIATGTITMGTELRESAVMQKSKVVADAGAGGQLLMDQATFLAVKERLEELGAVDHNGLNNARLNKIRAPIWICMGREHARQSEALVLDMGEYVHSSAEAPTLLNALGHKVDALNSSPPKEPEVTLKLYQILPPPLVARAKVFGNKLALKAEDWTCVDQPYFSAPGSMEAPLMGIHEGQISLPPVTMVFCCVEGGKEYAKKHREEAHAIHLLIAGIIRCTLREVPGSYLCRMQDGDLKYMVVFSSPLAAIAWCLVMQEVMLFAAWSPDVLLHDKFKVERGADGELLFRGPRLKMGVCEGQPKTIIPDHLARADYHGASVNQSARYMDAGAHGGQVVCEEKLAVEVLKIFNEAIVSSAQSNKSTVAVLSRGMVESHSETAFGLSPPSSLRGNSLRDFQPAVGLPSFRNLPAVREDEGESEKATICSVKSDDLAAAARHCGDEGLPVSGEAQILNGLHPNHVGVITGPARSSASLEAPNFPDVLGKESAAHCVTSINGNDLPPSPTIAILLSNKRADSAAAAVSHCDVNPVVLNPLDQRHISRGFGSELSEGEVARATGPSASFVHEAENGHSAVEPKSRMQATKSDLGPQPVLLHHSNGSISVTTGTRIKTSTSLPDVTALATPYPNPKPYSAEMELCTTPDAAPVSTERLSIDFPPNASMWMTLGPGQQPYVTGVKAFKTGVFRFKGSGEDIHMVHVTTKLLEGRTFPSDPPKGKGNRVAEASGLASSGNVQLPDTPFRFRETSNLASDPSPPEGGVGRLRSFIRTLSASSKRSSGKFSRSSSKASSFAAGTMAPEAALNPLSPAGSPVIRSPSSRSTNLPAASTSAQPSTTTSRVPSSVNATAASYSNTEQPPHTSALDQEEKMSRVGQQFGDPSLMTQLPTQEAGHVRQQVA
ncbi:hypothetical protein CEUSTIGMA_g2027.t1 [Chlamydomonas eustigma]|uniref:Uncharacterized protein n=1 Tax=Chlamydomonas eustigma TaxID=1157962 RepID=A0A250WUT0_9CHLO|nr:hypothetical protein CEUSTIGMA_g2027.t1 [Chlamydomonas eustigma]|eukprot:GAX74578.1 hypothetical protein CEUSTIGMA_g2027.t1 [Chlamydomonas eustigma]